MSEKILAALSKLNPTNDNHWTADGQPRIDTLRMIAGDPSITREAIVAADASFTREKATAALAGEPEKAAPVDAAVAATPPVDLVQPGATTEPAVDPVQPERDIAAEIADIAGRIERGNRFVNEAKKELEALQAEHDALIVLRDGDESLDSKTQNAVQTYLAAQVAAREKAGAQMAEVKQVASTKSPLDTALAMRRR